jgi:hypothetical protein
MRGAGFVAACVALALVHGCAAEIAPATPAKSVESTPAREEAEPATLEEAQAQLGRALAQLRGVAPGTPPVAGQPPIVGGAGGTATGGTTTTTTTGPAPTATAATEASKAGPTTADQAADSRCVTGCRAIASMRRAVAAICRLAGTEDTRCTDARRTLGDSETKVAGCGC